MSPREASDLGTLSRTGRAPMSGDILDTWKDLLDEQRQRGDVYRAALVELRELVMDPGVSRAKLREAAVAIYERAADDAWAKPGQSASRAGVQR